MTKDQRSDVAEYASAISESDLFFLTTRLTDKYVGDLPEAVNFMSRDEKMNAVLDTAKSGIDFYTMLDQMRDTFKKTCQKRGINMKFGPSLHHN